MRLLGRYNNVRVGKWRLGELLTIALVGAIALAGLIGFFGAYMGWWDRPHPGVDPSIHAPTLHH